MADTEQKGADEQTGGGDQGSFKYITYDTCSLIAMFFLTVTLPMIVVLRKVWKNYSSLILIIVLELMAID